jgi:hypothetical protein
MAESVDYINTLKLQKPADIRDRFEPQMGTGKYRPSGKAKAFA